MAIIFQDDFNRSDSTTVGVDYTEYDGDWAIISNQVGLASFGSRPVLMYNGAIPSADYAVQAFIAFNGAATSNAGVGIRNYYNSSTGQVDGYAVVIIPALQTIVLGKTVNGTDTTIASTTDSTISQFGTSSHILRLEAEGTTLRVYLDGVLKITATDSEISSTGSPTLGSTNANTAIRWDDFLVEDFTTGGVTYDQPMDFASATLFDVVKTAMYGRSLEYSVSAELFLNRLQKLSRQFEYNARAKLELGKIAAIYESLEFKSDVRYETTNKQLLNRGIKFVAKPVLDAKRFLSLMNSLSYLTYAKLDVESIQYIFNEFDFSTVTEFDIRKWSYYERNIEFKAFALLELLTQQAGAIRATLSFISGTTFSIGRVMNITRSLEAKVNTILELTKSITATINLYLDFASGAKLVLDKKQKRFANFITQTRTKLELYAYKTIFKSVAFYAKTLLQLYKSRHLFKTLQAKSFAKYNNSRIAKFFRTFGAKAHALMKLVADISAPDIVVKYIGAAVDGGEFASVNDFLSWLETNHNDLVAENRIYIGKIVSMTLRETYKGRIDLITDDKRYVKIMTAPWVGKAVLVPKKELFSYSSIIELYGSAIIEDIMIHDAEGFGVYIPGISNVSCNMMKIKRCRIPQANLTRINDIVVQNCIFTETEKSFKIRLWLNENNNYAYVFNNTILLDNKCETSYPNGIDGAQVDNYPVNKIYIKNNFFADFRDPDGCSIQARAILTDTGLIADANKNIIFDEESQVPSDIDRSKNLIVSGDEKVSDYILYPYQNPSPVGNKNMMAQGEDLSSFFDDDFTGRKRKKGNYDIGAIAEIHPDNVSKLYANKIIPFARKRVDKLLRSDKQKVTLDKKGNAYYVSLSFKSNNN